MTREEIQADAEAQVVPREVADKLAEAAVKAIHAIGVVEVVSEEDDDLLAESSDLLSDALAEYRKAVSGG